MREFNPSLARESLPRFAEQTEEIRGLRASVAALETRLDEVGKLVEPQESTVRQRAEAAEKLAVRRAASRWPSGRGVRLP